MRSLLLQPEQREYIACVYRCKVDASSPLRSRSDIRRVPGLITRRTGEQAIISQVPGIVALVNKLVEAGFEPVRESSHPALPAQ